MTALGNVPCNGCRACCLHDMIPLLPERGDLIWTYKHEVVATAAGPKAVLQRGKTGECIYLVPVHKAAFLLPLEEAGRISGVVRTRFCARRGLRRSILHASSRQTCSKREQWAWESIRRRRR